MKSSIQFSFLNGPTKLVFVRMYGSTITGLLRPPYPYCLLVALALFCAFLCLLHTQKHSQGKINKQNKNKLTLNNKGNNVSRVQTSKRIKVTYFALAYSNIYTLTLPFFLFVF